MRILTIFRKFIFEDFSNEFFGKPLKNFDDLEILW